MGQSQRARIATPLASSPIFRERRDPKEIARSIRFLSSFLPLHPTVNLSELSRRSIPAVARESIADHPSFSERDVIRTSRFAGCGSRRADCCSLKLRDFCDNFGATVVSCARHGSRKAARCAR